MRAEEVAKKEAAAAAFPTARGQKWQSVTLKGTLVLNFGFDINERDFWGWETGTAASRDVMTTAAPSVQCSPCAWRPVHREHHIELLDPGDSSMAIVQKEIIN